MEYPKILYISGTCFSDDEAVKNGIICGAIKAVTVSDSETENACRSLGAQDSPSGFIGSAENIANRGRVDLGTPVSFEGL